MGGTEFSLVRFKGDTDKVEQTYAGADALTPEDVAQAVFGRQHCLHMLILIRLR